MTEKNKIEELEKQVEEQAESIEECLNELNRISNSTKTLIQKNEHLKNTLEEIRDIASQTIIDYTEIVKNNEKLKALDIRNRMSEIQNIITEAIGK